MTGNSPDTGLIYDWSRERHFPVLPVLVMVIVALALHAASFYLIQIVYPESVSLRPPPAVLNLQPAQLAGNDIELHWLAGEDPSLSVSWSLSPLPLPSAIFRSGASGNASPAALQLLPAPPTSVSPPLPDAIPKQGLTVQGRTETSQSSGDLTRVMLEAAVVGPDGRLSSPVGVTAQREFIEQAVALPLPGARLLAEPDGTVAHVFLLESTGNHEVDSAYATLLKGLQIGEAAAGWHKVVLGWRLLPPGNPAETPPAVTP